MFHFVKNNFQIIGTVLLTSLITSTSGQTVSIPDPALESVIRETLGKPSGPLTQQDMLGLTNLSAIFRNVTKVQGLEAAPSGRLDECWQRHRRFARPLSIHGHNGDRPTAFLHGAFTVITSTRQ